MKVSVIIPAYNEEIYLARCLDSLMRQTTKPDEIIVVNNNSTDATVAIAKKYPVRIVNEKEQGMIQARNRGFNEAQYKIIARTDADTIVPIDWIKKIKQNFTDKKLVALSGPSHFYDLPTELSTKAAMNVLKTYISLMKSILKHDCLFGPNMAIRKDAWEKIKDTVCLDNNKVHEDIDLAIHIARLGEIKFDKTLEVSSSFRRFKTLEKIDAYFEYPYRVVRSIQQHKPFSMKQNGKDLMKKFANKVFVKELP